MKRLLVVAGILLAVATGASAQTATRNFDINLGAGLSIPIGNFGDAAGIGFHGDGSLIWHWKPQINVGPAASIHFFGNDVAGASGSWTEVLLGGTIQYLFATPMTTTDSGTKIMPFLDGGLGIGFTSAPSSIGGGSSSDLFISLGAGANMQRWFGKIRWVDVTRSGSSASFFPLTIGYRF